MNLILASTSEIRKTLLEQAGVVFTTQPSRVDEEQIKASLLADGAKPRDVADALAEYKALRVAGKFPQDTVIGCDQVLECDGVLYDKAQNMDQARVKLRALRGKPHTLLSAAVIYEDLKPVWRTVGRAQLFMRDFSDDFLDGYLDRNQDKILHSVGCYLLEEEGVQLFSRIQGDYFTVLGFPLLEVLGYLRTKGLIPA
jgi:septum formation protein